jgi:hypothetical protein
LAKEYKTLVQSRAIPLFWRCLLFKYHDGKKAISASWDKTLKLWSNQVSINYQRKAKNNYLTVLVI